MENVATIYAGTHYVCHGNNVFDVYGTTTLSVELCREGKGAIVIIVRTFRMGGHATHDEGESRRILRRQEFEYSGKRDTIGMCESTSWNLISSSLPHDPIARHWKRSK
jgi:TPP-dependent pyruvate/acetoin dehydrogenase alpha subunit